MPAAVFAFYVPEGSKERLLKNQSSRAALLRRKGNKVLSSELEDELERLERFPVTNSVIDFPRLEGADRVQVEPEFAVLCDIVYHSDSLEHKNV